MFRPVLMATAGLITCSSGLAFWQVPGYALTSTLVTAVGYDSNLTESHDGQGDGFIQASPSLTFQRADSSSDIELTGTVTGVDYFADREPAHVDYKVEASYYYPKADNVLPEFSFDGSWAKITEANEWLGLYVEHDRGAVNGDGYLPVFGKLGFVGDLSFVVDNYKLVRLDDYESANGSVGLGFRRDSGSQISLNIGGSLGSSTPNDEADFGGPVRSKAFYVTAKIQGEITPKITGSAYVGYSDVGYSGAYVNRYDVPVGGADLTWGVTTRSTFVLAAYSGADFSPDGQAVHTTHGFLSFTHVIVDQWQFTVRAGPAYSVFSRTVEQSTDLLWDFGSEIAYQPSERFRIALGIAVQHQNSDVLNNQFQREATTLSASYHL